MQSLVRIGNILKLQNPLLMINKHLLKQYNDLWAPFLIHFSLKSAIVFICTFPFFKINEMLHEDKFPRYRFILPF